MPGYTVNTLAIAEFFSAMEAFEGDHFCPGCGANTPMPAFKRQPCSQCGEKQEPPFPFTAPESPLFMVEEAHTRSAVPVKGGMGFNPLGQWVNPNHTCSGTHQGAFCGERLPLPQSEGKFCPKCGKQQLSIASMLRPKVSFKELRYTKRCSKCKKPGDRNFCVHCGGVIVEERLVMRRLAPVVFDDFIQEPAESRGLW